jgi:nicotinamide-nucleotide amidase
MRTFESDHGVTFDRLAKSAVSADETRALARSLLDLCRARKLTIATAESCTGGLVAAALTDIPGSSDVVMCGFVSYSNQAKHEMLGVRNETLVNFGAVSKETALAMASGALKKARTDLAVSITGIAGPGGATPGKPVGLVHLGAAARDGRTLHLERRFGALGRSVVRQRSVADALKLLIDLARGPKSPKKIVKLVSASARSRRRATRKSRKSPRARRRPSRL